MARTGNVEHEEIVDDIRFGINEIVVKDLKLEGIGISAWDMMSMFVTGQHGKGLSGKKIPDVLVWRSGEGVAIEVGRCEIDKWGCLPMIHVSFGWGIASRNCESEFSRMVLGWIETIKDRLGYNNALHATPTAPQGS